MSELSIYFPQFVCCTRRGQRQQAPAHAGAEGRRHQLPADQAEGDEHRAEHERDQGHQPGTRRKLGKKKSLIFDQILMKNGAKTADLSDKNRLFHQI